MQQDAVKTAIEEYRSLREEILARLQVQQRLTEFGLVLFTVFLLAISYAVLTDRVTSQNATTLSTLVLAASLPFNLLLWAHQEQNVFISLMGHYLNKHIKPVLEIGWEDFLSEQRKLAHNLVTHSRFVFLMIAAITPIITASFTVAELGQTFTPLGWIILLTNIALLIGVIWSRAKTVQSFKAI